MSIFYFPKMSTGVMTHEIVYEQFIFRYNERIYKEGDDVELHTMQRIASWGKFVGITMIVLGSIHAFFGLFAFIIGAIPGVLTIIMGYFIYLTGRKADEFLETHSEVSLAELLKSYSNYLLMMGILLIIFFSLIALSILFVLLFGFGIFVGLSNM